MKMSNDSKVKALLQETILTLCRASIDFKRELRIEGVIGITIDGDRVLLVSLHKTEKPRNSTFSGSSQDKLDNDSVVRMSSVFDHSNVVESVIQDQRAAKREAASVGHFGVLNTAIDNSLDATADGDSSMQFDNNEQEDEADVKPCIDSDGNLYSEENNLPFWGDGVFNSCSNTIAGTLQCSSEDTSGETVSNVLPATKRAKSFQSVSRSSRRQKPIFQHGPGLSFVERIKAIRLHEKMQSSTKVAEHLGVGKDQIRRILSHKDELLAHAQHDADGKNFAVRKKSLPFPQRVEAIHLYDVLRSTKKVAKHFGVGPTQIRDILKRKQELLSMAEEVNEQATLHH